MFYTNPIIKGFYPDPSVCRVGDTYYLVCSSMQYFPAVPLFESKDLINWTQIGHCLTRESQIDLSTVPSSGGVFAPTIRYHEGRFYMCTTNSTSRRNFFVWTDNIYGEWSEPIYVEQDGIDPSLFFDNGKTYFLSTGLDDDGVDGIVQCEINIETGEKLTKSQVIWLGSGGRYIEGPHMYQINGYYYLLAAEGGTEYGHMVTYARSTSPYGPFTLYKDNPVLTNRNLGGYEIQGVGHGDLIEDTNGNWWLFHLGFRQIGKWLPFHHLGREVFLSPVTWTEDGWFLAGENGTTKKEFPLPKQKDDSFHSNLQKEPTENFLQKDKKRFTFDTIDFKKELAYLRIPEKNHYQFHGKQLDLVGTSTTLDMIGSPTWIGLRQKDFLGTLSCTVSLTSGEAGITIFMDEAHHYDLALRKNGEHYEVIERLNIGEIKSIQHSYSLNEKNKATLFIQFDNEHYHFFLIENEKQISLGKASTRYLSSEVAGGFTGVFFGLYAIDSEENGVGTFTDFCCEYS